MLLPGPTRSPPGPLVPGGLKADGISRGDWPGLYSEIRVCLLNVRIPDDVRVRPWLRHPNAPDGRCDNWGLLSVLRFVSFPQKFVQHLLPVDCTETSRHPLIKVDEPVLTQVSQHATEISLEIVLELAREDLIIA